MMDKIDKILEYVRKSNPGMTRERLVAELGESVYSAKSLIFTMNFSQKNFSPRDFDTPSMLKNPG